jgi:peroxiredoxin
LTVEVGQRAPDFALYDTEQELRSLREFRDKNVIIAFYPGAFTSVCTREMCTFRDSLVKLDSLNGQVIGLSVNDPFSNKAFKEANELNFPLLSDYNRKTIELYGVEATDFAGLEAYTAAKRAIFILDKKGIIRYKWISEDPAKEPDYSEIETRIQALS